MNRGLMLILILYLYTVSLKSQQVYECKDFGFKFVITEKSDGYSYYSVPLITYIVKGSPADEGGMLIGTELERITGLPDIKNKTGDEVLHLLETRQYDCCLSMHSTLGWNQSGELYINMYSYTTEFPSAKQSPIPGGEKLLGTCVANCKEDIKTILYENGDRYTGSVINKIYPDPEYKSGVYTSLKNYNASVVNKFLTDSLNAQNAIKAKKEKEDLLAKEQLEKEKERILKIEQEDKITAREIINQFDQSKYNDGIICGVGVELQTYFEGTTRWWQVSNVVPGSSAWFNGIDSGDVIGYIVDAKNVDGLSTKNLTKIEVVKFLTGNFNEERSIIFMQLDAGGGFLNKKLSCLTPLNLKDNFSEGFISGNGENGYAIYINKKGDISFGNFANYQLNGAGELYFADGSLLYKGNFLNGKMNGDAIVQVGRGIQSYGKLITKSLQGTYVNDELNGDIKVNAFGIQNYIDTYDHGKLIASKMVFDNGDYCICDFNDNMKIGNCFDKTNNPKNYSDAGIVSAPVVINNNNYNNIDPNLNTTTYESESLLPNMKSVAEKFKRDQPGFTWYDGGALVFHPDAIYDNEYIRLTIPAHKTLQLHIIMEPVEVEKVRFFPQNLYYQYQYVDGGAPLGFAEYWENMAWIQTYTATNNYEDYAAEFNLEIRTVPASVYFTRTLYYIYGFSDN